MKPNILLLDPMMQDVEARLDADYTVHRPYLVRDRAALISRIGPAVRAIVTGGQTGANNELIDALPSLEIIAINGIGTDKVDLQHARTRSISVTTTPDVLTDDVADMAIALLLARHGGFASPIVLCGPGGGRAAARRWQRGSAASGWASLVLAMLVAPWLAGPKGSACRSPIAICIPSRTSPTITNPI